MIRRWRPRAMPSTLFRATTGERFLMFVQVVAHRRTVALDPPRYTWAGEPVPVALWLKAADVIPPPTPFRHRATGELYWYDETAAARRP